MMGKDAWVAGADRREAPGPKPVRLGRRLQPPGSWQLWNGGVQREVSIFHNLFVKVLFSFYLESVREVLYQVINKRMSIRFTIAT